MVVAVVSGWCLIAASTHSSATHLDPPAARYWQGQNTSIQFEFDDSSPGECGSNFKDRIRDGGKEWQDLAASDFSFTLSSCTEVTRTYGECYSSPDLVYFFGPIAGDAIGVTGACVNPSGSIAFAAVKFDNSTSWYKGASASGIGSNEHDLQSVATHEDGHAAGTFWNNKHVTGGDPPHCQNVPQKPTMCASILAGATNQRTLESEDKGPFNHQY
jgi:hypothetical protein